MSTFSKQTTQSQPIVLYKQDYQSRISDKSIICQIPWLNPRALHHRQNSS